VRGKNGKKKSLHASYLAFLRHKIRSNYDGLGYRHLKSAINKLEKPNSKINRIIFKLIVDLLSELDSVSKSKSKVIVRRSKEDLENENRVN